MDIQKAIEWQKAFKKTYNGMPKEADEVCDFTISALEELAQYRQIGTVDECRTAREQMKPKKIILNSEPGREYEDYICPSCKDILQQRRKGATAILIYHFKHCPNCGQALDWTESEEK